MSFRKHLLILFFSSFVTFPLWAEGSALDGLIAVIDVETAILSTEVSKQAFEELASSKEWKEVEEDLKLKINEANPSKKKDYSITISSQPKFKPKSTITEKTFYKLN